MILVHLFHNNRYIVGVFSLDRERYLGYKIICNTYYIKGISVLGGLVCWNFHPMEIHLKSVSTNLLTVC